MGKPRVGKNEKSNWEASLRCFSHSFVLIALNIFSSFFRFSWVDHVVFLGLIAFKLIERAEL